MNTLTKTPEQIEIAEIFDRLEKSYGMKKADVARELNLERNYVGYLVQGRRNPSKRTLDQFRELEIKKKSTTPTADDISQENELKLVYDRIAVMEKHDRPNFEVVKKIVESLAPTSSKSDAPEKRLLKKAVVSVQKSDPK